MIKNETGLHLLVDFSACRKYLFSKLHIHSALSAITLTGSF